MGIVERIEAFDAFQQQLLVSLNEGRIQFFWRRQVAAATGRNSSQSLRWGAIMRNLREYIVHDCCCRRRTSLLLAPWRLVVTPRDHDDGRLCIKYATFSLSLSLYATIVRLYSLLQWTVMHTCGGLTHSRVYTIYALPSSFLQESLSLFWAELRSCAAHARIERTPANRVEHLSVAHSRDTSRQRFLSLFSATAVTDDDDDDDNGDCVNSYREQEKKCWKCKLFDVSVKCDGCYFQYCAHFNSITAYVAYTYWHFIILSCNKQIPTRKTVVGGGGGERYLENSNAGYYGIWCDAISLCCKL